MGGITLSGADGIVDVRGTYKSITDNRTGAPTLTITGAIKGSDVASTLEDTAAMQPLVAKIPLSDGSISWNATALAAINAEADTALSDYDPPTRTEATSDKDEIIVYVDILDDGTSGNAKIATDVAATLADTVQLQEGIIYGACGSTSLTTTTCSSDLSGYTADQLIGRVIIFTALANGPATGEATDITDYAVTNGVLTFTALTLAPENLNSFKIV